MQTDSPYVSGVNNLNRIESNTLGACKPELQEDEDVLHSKEPKLVIENLPADYDETLVTDILNGYGETRKVVKEVVGGAVRLVVTVAR